MDGLEMPEGPVVGYNSIRLENARLPVDLAG
jgi:hypothetical protein